MSHRETIAAPVLDEKDDEVDQVTNHYDNLANRNIYRYLHRLAEEAEHVCPRFDLPQQWQEQWTHTCTFLHADYSSAVREITGVLDKFPKPWQSSTLQLLCKIQPQFTEHMYTLAECVVHELLHFFVDETRKSQSAIAVC